MQRISRREYKMKLAWLDGQYDTPRDGLGIIVGYLMQIAAEIRRVLAKNPKGIKLDHFKLKWGRQQATQRPLTPEEATKQSKSRWRSVLGGAMAVTRQVLSGKRRQVEQGKQQGS